MLRYKHHKKKHDVKETVMSAFVDIKGAIIDNTFRQAVAEEDHILIFTKYGALIIKRHKCLVYDKNV